MVDQILEEFEQNIESLEMIPSAGGVFEVTVDGDLVYSKAATGEHPEYEQVAQPIRDR